MITKIGIFIVATYFMFDVWAKDDGDYIRLIAFLLYLIIVLLASRKEK